MVSAIIVSHNNPELLKDCLESLQRQTFNHIETTVVFNGCHEEIINDIKNNFSKITLVINKKNLLFCKAYNQGIALAKEDYVLCLNDDVVLEDNFIEELVKAMSCDKQIGMANGKILRMDKATIDSTGLFLGRSRKPLERGYSQADRGQFDKEGYIFGASAAAAIYRKEMLEDIKDENGYFDERYGMFYEDLDLAWRANKKGWRAYYNPRAIAYHKRGASTKTLLPKPKFLKNYHFAYLSDELKVKLIKNRYRTMAKNDSFLGLILNLPFVLAYELKLYCYIVLFSPGLLFRILRTKSD